MKRDTAAAEKFYLRAERYTQLTQPHSKIDNSYYIV